MPPLKGLKVLDLGSALAAPYCATLLGELGADVIKIEKPRRGDLIRFTDTYVGGQSGYYLGINRQKDGVTVDIRKPEGQAILRELAAEADVLVENFRSTRMAEWGLGYEQLKAINPRLIYASISAFGGAEGFEELGGNDIIGQAASGLLDLTGDPDGPPAKAGTPVVDVSGGMLATIGILAAVQKRHVTGVGSHVQISLLEAAYALMCNYATSVLNGEPNFTRQGSGHPQLAPYQAFEASDGKYVVVGAFHRSSWLAFCEALGRQDLVERPEFKDNWDRVKNRAALVQVLAEEMKKRPSAEWVRLFRERNVLAAPVLSMRESLDTFGQAIPGLLVKGSHAQLGELRMLRTPILIDGEVPDDRPLRAGPVLGEATQAQLQAHGFTAEQVAAWAEQGIV